MDNIIFGIRPVAEAIEAGRQIEKLYIRKGAEGQLMTELKDLCIRHRVRMQEVPVEKLNRLTRGNHQGVVAQISAIEYVGLADILERVPEDETPLVVIFRRGDRRPQFRRHRPLGRVRRGARSGDAAEEFGPRECRGNPLVGRGADGDPGLPRGVDPQHGQAAPDRRDFRSSPRPRRAANCSTTPISASRRPW